MEQKDARIGVAREFRGLHETSVAANVGLGPRQSRVERKIHHRRGDDDVGDGVAEGGDDSPWRARTAETP